MIGSDLVRDEVKGNYCIWAMEAEDQTSFIHADDGSPWPGSILVAATVTRAGWDNNWVLIEQIPRMLPGNKPSQGSPHRQWFIFSLAQERLYGPFDHKKFVAQRSTLGVPAALDLARQYTKP